MATADTRRWQQVVTDSATTGVAVGLDEHGQRVRLGLAFLDGSKVVDVSADPASWVGCLRTAARATYEPHNRWTDALTTGLRRTGAERGWWDELPEQLPPETTAAAAAWPLARPAIEAGFDERAVPRWAIPLLSATDVASGTRAVLGRRTNRRVIREMANALSGPVRWWPIACAIAIEQLDPDRIADLLASSPTTYRCTQDERLLLSSSLRRARPDLVRRLLTSAEVDNGPQRLLAALDGWQRIPAHNRQIPNRLDRLEAAVLAELEIAPPPRPRPQQVLAPPPHPQPPLPHPRRPQPRRPQPRRPQRQREQQRPHRTDGQAPTPTTDHITHCDPWRTLHRARSGSVELVLPARRQDLIDWGKALNNCLGAYRHAVDQNRTVIVGIRNDGRLVGALEIDPTRRVIRQIEGSDNRPLAPALRQNAIGIVQRLGLLEPARSFESGSF